MPAGQVYAKAIMNFNASAIGGTTPYINISFEVKENYNDTTAYDSFYLYSYFLPIAETSMNLVLNQDSGYAELFEVTSGKIQISFANNEYFDINNNQFLNPADVYAAVNSVLLA